MYVARMQTTPLRSPSLNFLKTVGSNELAIKTSTY
jgi:hypothetical protein